MATATRLPEHTFWTVEQGASWLNVTRLHLYDLIRRGEVPAVRVGRAIRLDPSRLKEWAASGGTRSDQ